MPVDKFGRMSDAKTKDTGVSLTYINNNYIRNDGSTPVSGSIDMRGNTLYNVSDPVNPQDVATKEYADKVGGGETAIIKTRYGTYGSKGNIDMRGYTLMNVLDPADAQDVATKKYVDSANKAFIYGEGKYLAAGDVSMGGRRSDNVGIPIENHQASNKFYVDTLVEAATAGDKALSKIQDGIFASTGDIDMGGNSITGLPNPVDRDSAARNSITGLPNPVDRDSAASKNYVDNGGAIIKNPDGSFTAVSDIDFIGFRLKNLSPPKDDRDAVNKFYVDKKVSLPSLISPKPIITVWAEEKGPLGNGNYEFSFGNGSSGSGHAYGGYCMSAPGKIIRGSLTATESKNIFAEEVKVNIVVNGIEQVNQSIIKNPGDICSCTVFNDPVELKQCDIINFISRTANSKITNAYVSFFYRVRLVNRVY